MFIRLASATALAILAFAAPAQAGFFGRSYDEPVIYRPIVNPQVYYFQPAPVHYAAPPHHRVRAARACRPGAQHGQPRTMRRCR
ncbi:hypothetical protein [Phreatobacter stygius]|uniref:Uncharacterized protein n=1 Tax=Phreatobacter stygius TaxID=1940610 RepID=A0A4D7AUR2_9HYPH|nr:hypothetical protein [Phreatobacter stygius]QCI64629.1 hypothetical protein E8M01_10565 [Phreatobacter stygius]